MTLGYSRAQYIASLLRKYDSVYELPKIVQAFVQRAENGECPPGYYVMPWTLNRAVSVFGPDGAYVGRFAYEDIESDIVKCLNDLALLAEENQ